MCLFCWSFVQSWDPRLREKFDFFIPISFHVSVFFYFLLIFHKTVGGSLFWYEVKRLMCNVHTWETQREWGHHYYFVPAKTGPVIWTLIFHMKHEIRISYRKSNMIQCNYRTNYDDFFIHIEISWLLAAADIAEWNRKLCPFIAPSSNLWFQDFFFPSTVRSEESWKQSF